VGCYSSIQGIHGFFFQANGRDAPTLPAVVAQKDMTLGIGFFARLYPRPGAAYDHPRPLAGENLPFVQITVKFSVGQGIPPFNRRQCAQRLSLWKKPGAEESK
jgi:hypothetical protein